MMNYKSLSLDFGPSVQLQVFSVGAADETSCRVQPLAVSSPSTAKYPIRDRTLQRNCIWGLINAFRSQVCDLVADRAALADLVLTRHIRLANLPRQ